MKVNELAERLRAMGAVVVTEAQQRAHVERFEGLRRVGARLGNCHEDTCTHAHAVANDSSEDLDLVVQGHEATPLRDDDDRLVGPVGVSVDMLRFFVLDPWVSEERTVKSGADLSDDEVRELVNGGQGDWDADHVRVLGDGGRAGRLHLLDGVAGAIDAARRRDARAERRGRFPTGLGGFQPAIADRVAALMT